MKFTIARIFTFALGIFFLVSGYGKTIDSGAFIQLIYQTIHLSSLSRLLGISIPALEMVLGICLCLSIRLKQMSLYALILLSAFTLIFAFGHFVRGAEDCGCFGAIESLKTRPWVSFLRNAILIAMAVFSWMNLSDNDGWPAWKLVIVLVTGATGFVLCGITAEKPLYPETSPYLGKYVSETPLNKFLNPQSDSTYLLYFFSANCPHCWDASANIKSYRTSGMVDTIMAVGIGTPESMNEYTENLHPNFGIQRVPFFDSIVSVTTTVPRAFLIYKNQVVRDMTGNEIISPYRMKKEMAAQ